VPGRKYGLLFLEVHPEDGAEGFDLDSSTRAWEGSLQDLAEQSVLEFWRTHMGTETWDRLEKKQLLVMTAMDSERPEVIDAENRALTTRLSRSWRALLLTGLFRPFHGEARIFRKVIDGPYALGISTRHWQPSTTPRTSSSTP
jgi:hypothetical protein